jgi:hypothetical protein
MQNRCHQPSVTLNDFMPWAVPIAGIYRRKSEPIRLCDLTPKRIHVTGIYSRTLPSATAYFCRQNPAIGGHSPLSLDLLSWGISIAYIFLDVFPELAHAQEEIAHSEVPLLTG